MTPADEVREALAILCRRAKVDPADASEAAAHLVCAVLRGDRCAVSVYSVNSPTDCSLAVWLREAVPTVAGVPYLGEPHILVTTERVLVFGARECGAKPMTPVDLPEAVRAAVRLAGERRAGLIATKGAA